MKNVILVFACLFSLQIGTAQTDFDKISETLTHYMEGTANGQPDRLHTAFHPDFKLYFSKNDSLNVWSGQEYIGNIKEGRKSNRIGRIVSIDYVGDAASAKVEIDMPDRKRLYTDYFLLLKLEGEWKIIHKSFTFSDYPE